MHVCAHTYRTVRSCPLMHARMHMHTQRTVRSCPLMCTHTIEIRIYKCTVHFFMTYLYTPFTLNTGLIKKQLS